MVQQSGDLDRIERNIQKMRDQGADPAEIKMYLDSEEAKMAGSPPANPKPNEVKVTTAQGGFLTGDTPTPDAGPPKRSIFTPEEEANIKAYVEDQLKSGTLTPEGYQSFLQDLSGGELSSPNPEVDVANFTKFGWGGTQYPDATTENKANDELQKDLAANPERFNDAVTFGVNLGDGALLNFSTELVSGAKSLVETLNPFDSKSGNFWNNYKGNYAEASAKMEQMAKEDPLLAATGNIIGSTVGPTARIGIRNPGWKGGAAEGFVTGGAAGIGAGEGSLYERLDEGAIGAAIGTPLGATVGAIAPRATSGRRDELWLNNQIEKNPYAAYDAEIVEDLGKVVTTTAKSPIDPKGRADLTAKEINNLEQAYTGRFKEKIGKLDISPSQQIQLKEFLDGKYTLDQTNIDLLRGTPEGDAVADGITKVQRLRALTPEIKRKGFANVLKEVVSGTAGIASAFGGNAVLGPVGTGVGPLTWAAMRYGLQRVGNAEAARVNAADNLLDQAKRYQMLGERVGPSGAMESKQTFDNLVNEKLDGTWLAKKAKEAEARDAALLKTLNTGVPAPLDRVYRKEGKKLPAIKDAEKFIRDQEKAMSSVSKPLDKIVKAEEKAIKDANKADEKAFEKAFKADNADMRSDYEALAKKAETAKTAAERLIGTSRKKAEGWQTKFDKATATKPVKVDPKDAAIQKNIEEGFEGTSRVQQSFAERVGVPEADMLRALDQVAGEFPELADDIKRIQFKYPTKTRGLADILVPRMKAVLEQDGTMAKVKAQAEQAQAKTSARLKLANPNAETTTAAPQPTQTRAAEGDMVGISRPEQWEAGARNFQAQANASISKLDSMASEKAMTAYGNAPEVIRDSFRTTEEAVEYIKEVVMPELEIAGVDPTEIANIRSYLYEVAAAKRYPTREAYEAGTKKKQ